MSPKKRNTPKASSAKSPPSKPPVRKGLHLNLSPRIKEEIVGVAFMALSVFGLLAVVTHRPEEQPGTIMDLWRADRLHNMMGVAGAYASHLLAAYTFGYAAIAFPILLLVFGWLVFTHRSIFLVNQFTFYLLTLMVLVSVWLALPSTISAAPNWDASGLFGGIIAQSFYGWLSGVGAIMVWSLLSVVWFIMVTRISVADLIPAIRNIFLLGFRRTSEMVDKLKERQDAEMPSDAEASEAVSRSAAGLVPQYLKEQPLEEPPVLNTPVVEPPAPEEKKPLEEKPEAKGDAAPAADAGRMKNSDISFDTGLVKDMKSLGRIDKQFVIPDLDLNDTPSGDTTEEEIPPPVRSEEDTTTQERIDLQSVDLRNLAKHLFDRELAHIDLDGMESFPRAEDGKATTEEGVAHGDEERNEDMPPEPAETPDEVIEIKRTVRKKEARVSDEAVGKSRDIDKENQSARKQYKHPSLDLLEPTQEMEKLSQDEIKELDEKIHQIISTLSQFGINTKVVDTEYGGPVVAIYQLDVPSGLKLSRVTGLEDELAMSLKVKSVRMVPVTAKGTIQVEIPKPKPTPVLIRSIFEDRAFKNARQKYRLGLALGKTIDGAIHIEDLARMPHLLIAGTTGSGKSVGVNSMITSLLYQFDPSEVKFIMIDPKKVELALYRNLKNHHLICLCNQAGEIIEDVITKPENARMMLKALVEEMEERYEKLAHANVRNIEDYNKRWQEGDMPTDGKYDHFKLEYIIAIIDELADLMMTSPREVETSITRLAQMARAVGIHLVVATQRPSVDVLTGLIKANFPARIAYQVRSKIDSRTILDMSGAELLLGKGDMLYLPPGQMPIRIQNAFTSTKETEQIVDYISRMPPFPPKYFVIKEEAREDVDGDAEAGAVDSLFNEALEIVVRHNQGSASLLQRRLSVGYARAARIIDQLERAGIVSAQEGGKPRQVLITEDQMDDYRV